MILTGRLVASDQVTRRLSSPKLSTALVSDSPASGTSVTCRACYRSGVAPKDLHFYRTAIRQMLLVQGHTLRVVTVLEDDFKITFPNPPNYSHSTLSNQTIIVFISLPGSHLSSSSS